MVDDFEVASPAALSRHSLDVLHYGAMLVRRAKPTDADGILAIYEPVVRETAVSFEEDVPDAAEISRRIEASVAWFVCEDGEEVVGYAYASQFHPRSAYRWSVEVSVYVASDHQRRGVGDLLLDSLLSDLKSRGFANAFAGIALPNDASAAFFENFGFRRVAHYERVGFKLGSWRDVGWWQLRLGQTVTRPAEPQSQPLGGGPTA